MTLLFKRLVPKLSSAQQPHSRDFLATRLAQLLAKLRLPDNPQGRQEEYDLGRFGFLGSHLSATRRLIHRTSRPHHEDEKSSCLAVH